ncbi:hypothetical protein SETIT_8G241900v2 [Setaria italica]|uniref:Protein kinase domain-containing protein n=1 Tax=Setaria italica TaxID=4555 RepID=A0A368SB41_SETIT|nr:wall-associated receptor kinase 2-like [Setaria italica]RCV39665.1 hypothetical protein SETIT_8G241900v2 [Setaria italica]
MTQLQVLWLLLSPALVLSQVPAPVVSETQRAPPPGCPTTTMCGGVTIHYPFGLSEACSWDKSFTLSCNDNFSPPRPYLGNIEVMDITVETGEMRVYSAVAHRCFNSSKTVSVVSKSRTTFNFAGTPFLVKPGRNEFTGIGCYNLALLRGKEDRSYFSGCLTTCTSLDEAASAGNSNGCTGLGCCQILTPSDLNVIDVDWSTHKNSAWTYSPCGYALVAEKGWYKFSLNDLNGTGEMAYNVRVGDRSAPLVLDWAINVSRDGACVSSNSYSVTVRDGQGYLCNCSEGYQGNPYVKDGCKNINECLRPELYPCPSGSNCKDREGSYMCRCKFGRRGKDCRPIFPAPAAAVLATTVASLFLALLLWSIYKDRKRQIRTAFFDRNGGKILKGAAGINIFTEQQLKKFTNHYDTLIGRGAFGMVFMGTTDEKQRVAVKRSIVEGKELRGRGKNLQHGEDIVNEITFQFRNCHPNLVRLVGCCLETNIPVLVFEFISNGNLYNLLHVSTHKVVPLRTRLKIAIGSAEALAYIHSHGDHDCVHGDVKSANILLDDNLMPKVSDFGSSKLLSMDNYAMAVAADMSYVDPVYMKTERFVKKSDVYSFGMVLLELITRKTVKYGRSRINSLPMDFVRCCKEKGSGREMYDTAISSHGDPQCHHCIDCLDKIGALAVRCLKEDVDDRPTMAEVVHELKLAAEAVEKCKQHVNLIACDRSFCLEAC